MEKDPRPYAIQFCLVRLFRISLLMKVIPDSLLLLLPPVLPS